MPGGYGRILTLITFILHPILSQQHGCNSPGSCTLTSDSSYINSQIYCTENVDICSVDCTGPTGYLDGCRLSTIWLSASINTLTCDASQSCSDVTIYCGYPFNPSTPTGLSLTHFDENVIQCNVICNNFMACSGLQLYCNGNVSQCTMTAYNKDAFRDGLVECNNNEDEDNQCNINCDNISNMDCVGSVMNCNDMKHCSCSGNGCPGLQINSIQPTLSPSFNPMEQPTSEPTTGPTNEPTTDPILMALTSNPTYYPSIIPSISASTTSNEFESKIKETYSTDISDNLQNDKPNNKDDDMMFGLIVGGIILFFVIILCIWFILFWKKRKYIMEIKNLKITSNQTNITNMTSTDSNDLDVMTQNDNINDKEGNGYKLDGMEDINDTIAVIEAVNDLDVENIKKQDIDINNYSSQENVNVDDDEEMYTLKVTQDGQKTMGCDDDDDDLYQNVQQNINITCTPTTKGIRST